MSCYETYVHPASKKQANITFVYIFTKYGPIFKNFFSQMQSARNL